MEIKKQKEMENLIQMSKQMGTRKFPDSLFALVKKDGHFECQLHTRKTLDGILRMIRKKQAYIKGHSYFVYELPFKPEYVIYDSAQDKNNT